MTMIPKYRAWDSYDEKMVAVLSIDFENKVAYVEQENGDRYDIHFDNLKFMQSTGLKDKNGVEIFEGDIFAEGFGRYVVAWEDKGARWALKFVHDFEDAFHLGIRNSEEMTLIGNIYENPELLEVEQ